MDKIQEKLKNSLLIQEKKAVIWYTIIFYIIMFGFDFIAHLQGQGNSNTYSALDGVGLSYWFYIIFLLFLIPIIYFVKTKRPQVVKYIILFGFLIVFTIHQIIVYQTGASKDVFFVTHFFGVISILFAPMFVNRKWFFVVGGSILFKSIIEFSIFKNIFVLFPVGLAIIIMSVCFIILNRFISYITSLENSYKTEFELENYKTIAFKDDLTGIFNKRYLKIEIEQLENNRNENIAVLMTDIDKFKSVNDVYNHNVGDQTLKHFVDTIKMELSEDDIFARYGGEEFVLVLRGRSYEDTKTFVNNLRKKVAKSTAIVDFNGEKKELNITASFGLYYLTKEDKHTIKEAQNISDNLLYLSKKNGRNRITVNNVDDNALYNEDACIEIGD